MGKHKISMSLSDTEIDRAIRELADYKQYIIKNTEILRKRIAEYLAEESKKGFYGAIVDDVVQGGKRTAQVNVSITNKNTVSVVIANGEDAVWVEFGAGVYHNGASGSSPHPKGGELGFTIGGYGKGKGKRETWGYYDNGNLVLTHGTPASMPMAKAVTTICNDIVQIAKEVFI